MRALLNFARRILSFIFFVEPAKEIASAAKDAGSAARQPVTWPHLALVAFVFFLIVIGGHKAGALFALVAAGVEFSILAPAWPKGGREYKLGMAFAGLHLAMSPILFWSLA